MPKLPAGSQASHPQTSFTLRPHRLGGLQQPLPRFCPSAFASCTKLLAHPQRFTTENQNGLIPGKPLPRRLIPSASKSHHCERALAHPSRCTTESEGHRVHFQKRDELIEATNHPRPIVEGAKLQDMPPCFQGGATIAATLLVREIEPLIE